MLLLLLLLGKAGLPVVPCVGLELRCCCCCCCCAAATLPESALWKTRAPANACAAGMSPLLACARGWGWLVCCVGWLACPFMPGCW